jgi:hypothetical protein|tara:strand:+ start:3987 stop:5864 length:1878 start_codon:yes stop_codon:yes gene_type:complete
MASWKKIIVSGSSAELSAISLTGLSNQGSEATAVVINGSNVVGTRELGSNAFNSTTIGTTTNAIVDGNGIADFSFNGSSGGTVSLDLDGSTLSVGSSGVKISDAGVTGTQLATSVAGTGISGGGGSALSIGQSVATTANVAFNEITASGIISGSSLSISDLDNVNSINAGTTANGNLDFTTQGTVNLRASNSSTHGLQLFGGTNGAAKPHIGTVTHEFLDFNVGSTNDVIVLSGVAAGGMKAGEARFIGHVSASSVSASGEIYAQKYYGDGSGLSNLTSAANGTLTLATSGAINGAASFGANDSGDTTFTVSIDNATTSALGAASFASSDFAVSSGAVSIKADGVSYSQIQNVSATNVLLGRDSSGAGVIEEISAANVKTLLSLNNVPNSDHTDAGYSTVTQLNASSSALQSNIDGKQATLTFGISNTNVLRANAALANDDFLRVDGTSIEGRTAAQVRSDLGIEAGSTADQTAGEIVTLLAGDLGGNFTIGNQSSDTARFSGGVIVEGNLTINGDLTTVSTSALVVEDKFATFASGSTSSTDGGIIVQGAASAGQGFGWDSATARWAFDKDLGLDATGIDPDGYVSIVSGSAQDASGNPTYGGSSNGYGNIHINTSSGDIFIYV